ITAVSGAAAPLSIFAGVVPVVDAVFRSMPVLPIPGGAGDLPRGPAAPVEEGPAHPALPAPPNAPPAPESQLAEPPPRPADTPWLAELLTPATARAVVEPFLAFQQLLPQVEDGGRDLTAALLRLARSPWVAGAGVV